LRAVAPRPGPTQLSFGGHTLTTQRHLPPKVAQSAHAYSPPRGPGVSPSGSMASTPLECQQSSVARLVVAHTARAPPRRPHLPAGGAPFSLSMRRTLLASSRRSAPAPRRHLRAIMRTRPGPSAQGPFSHVMGEVVTRRHHLESTVDGRSRTSLECAVRWPAASPAVPAGEYSLPAPEFAIGDPLVSIVSGRGCRRGSPHCHLCPKNI